MFRLSTSSIGKQLQTNQRFITKRLFTNTQGYDALVLGAYTGTENGSIRLTAQKDISQKTRQLIEDQLQLSNFRKAGDVRTLYNVGGIKQVAVVSLGPQDNVKDNEQEAARRAVKYFSTFIVIVIVKLISFRLRLACTL
jgi:aminopeptidase